jgi:hypothetical protein
MYDLTRYERVLVEVFQQPPAYPFPFGSASMGWLFEASEADLRRLTYGRLRDQAVALDEVVARYSGSYGALYRCARADGLTPYLSEHLEGDERTLRRLLVQKQRLRPILVGYGQPRRLGYN